LDSSWFSCGDFSAHGGGAGMTDKLREAAQMALDALQESKPIDIDDPAAFYRSAHAIEALRVALAQPEREWQGLTPEEAREISLANRPYVMNANGKV